MKIGYARVSSQGQNLDRQLYALRQAGCDKIFKEKVSGKDLDRSQFRKMLKNLRKNDEIVVLAIDRLGRNMTDIRKTMEYITNHGATVDILNLPTFKKGDSNLRKLFNYLVIDLFSYAAENERKQIRTRQAEGIRIAKAKGKYKGGKPKFTRNSQAVKNAINDYRRRDRTGVSMARIAKRNGMSRSTLYNVLRKYN